MRATRAIIRLNNLANNIRVVRERTGARAGGQAGKRPLLCFPVKADAYGHGAVPVSKFALKHGADFLAVATVDEGAELREAGINAEILLLSQALPEELESAVKYGLTPFVSGPVYVKALASAAAKLGRQCSVFLKTDSGMGRLGCRPEDAAELAACISAQKHLIYRGTATHLAVSDSGRQDDIEYTKRQIMIFSGAADSVRKAGFSPGIVSAANTGASLFYPEAWFDMIRPGILLYGYPPVTAGADAVSKTGTAPWLPVMELVTRIVHIKKIAKGESVSYGRTWTAERDTYIGVLPVGYADGFPRMLTGQYQVAVNGRLYPLAGRICMDQCMIDLGSSAGDAAAVAVKEGDPVSVFGGAPAFSAQDIADKTHTIPYEILCNINKRVPRIYEE